MKLKNYFTEEAKQDLKEIRRYTKEQWGDRQSLKYLDAVERVFDAIAENPEIGMKREDIREDLQYFNHGRHVIFYMVLPKKLAIIRILSQRIKQENELQKSSFP